MEFLDGELDMVTWERTVRGTCLGDDFVELQGVLDAMKDELDEVAVFASLITDPTGEGAYIVKECAVDLLALSWLPCKLGELLADSKAFRGDRNDRDFKLRQSGESDESLGVISDPGLMESSFEDDASVASSSFP
jgi:hypothetical protein